MQQTSPVRRDFLLPTAPNCPSSHASFLHRSSRSGTLFVAFFTGTREGAPGNGIALSRYDDIADTWSSPIVLVTDALYSMQNPCLFDDSATGLLVLIHTCQDAGPFGISQRTSSVLQWTSSDDGRTWSDTPQIVFERGHGAFIRGPILTDSLNPLHRMLPLYFTPSGEFDHGAQRSAIVDSWDGGLTWDTSTCRAIPGTEGAVGVQPQVVRLQDGELVAFHRNRTERLGQRIGRSFSADDGATWSQLQPTQLPSNNSSTAALVLPDGRLLVAFNNALQARFPLSLAVSSDGGVTFDRVFDVVSDQVQGGGLPGPQGPRGFAGEHSYPSLWFDADRDRLWISWTHQRMTIAICELRLAFLDGPSGSIGEWNP